MCDGPGLTVKRIDKIQGVRVVEGTAPNGDRVLVLWRNIDKMDNVALDQWYEKQDYNTREMVHTCSRSTATTTSKTYAAPTRPGRCGSSRKSSIGSCFEVEGV